MALDALEPLSLRKPKRRPAALKIDEATASNMIEKLAGSLGSGLQYVGETLDKPGRAARGLLSGRPGELANLIPFSDTMGITDPRASTTGRQLLEQAGILGHNTPGLDMGDVAGFGAEVLTDPTTILTGPGKALAKGLALGKAINVGGKLHHLGISPTSIIDEIAKGQRGLIGLKLPFARQASTIIGTGPKAAKLAELAYYNPITRGIRQTFDFRLKGLAASGATPRAQREAEKMLHQGLDRSYAAQFDELANYQATMEGIAKRLPEVAEIHNDIHKAFPTVAPTNFDDALRNAAESKGLNYMQTLVSQAGAQPGSDLFQKAAQFDALAGQLTGLQNSAYKDIRKLGVRGKELDDLIAHTARTRNPAAGQHNLGRGRTGTGFPYATRRKEPLRRLSTTTINQITTDHRITATQALDKHSLDRAEQILINEFGVPASVKIKTASGKARNFKQARALARSIAKLPTEVIATGGLFPRSTAIDAMDYLKHATTIRGALSSVHDMAHKFASETAVGPTVPEFFRNLGLTTKGADSGLSTWYNTFVKNTGSNTPVHALHVPYELAEASSKILTYHKQPEKVASLIRWFDKATGIFKGGLTIPFPAFHSRNFVSGLWQNMVTAFRNPSSGAKAYKAVIDAMNGKNPELLTQLKIYGIVPDSMKALDDIFNATAPSSASVPKFGNVFNPFTAVRRTKENLKQGFRADRYKGAAKETVKGLGQWGRDANQLVEFLNRGAHFAARTADGWEPALAARSTKNAHFDYSELSDFEKKVMRRIIPFYTFSRKNLPLQIRELFNNPGGPTAQTIRGMVNARRATSGESIENQFTPKWLGEGLAFRLQGGDERDAKFFSESGLLPISEAFNRFPTMNGLPDARMIAENVAGMTNPIIAGPLQQLTGRQFWSHRDLGELAQTPFDNPTANFWLYQSPISRAASTARMLADERKTPGEKAFNALLGGARFTDVDIKKAINFQLRDILERELKGSAGVGEYSKLYARDLDKLSPQSQSQLSLLAQLLAEYKQMRAQDEKIGRVKPKKKAKPTPSRS